MPFFTIVGAIVVTLISLAGAIALAVWAYDVAESNTRERPRIAMAWTVLAALTMPAFLLAALAVATSVLPHELKSAPMFAAVLLTVSVINVCMSVHNELRRQRRFAR